MSLIVKKDGRLMCAAITKQQLNDTYIGDTIHHLLCSKKLIVTQKEPEHTLMGGQWWWRNQEPKDVKIDAWWYD